MTTRRARALALLLTAAAAVLPGRAAAQSFVPQPQQYLLSTDAIDGRALWVQPAGMVKRREATISGLLTFDHDSSRISQYGVTVASGNIGFGWQHDVLPAGLTLNTYAIGLAFGTERVAVGADKRWYRGTLTRDGSWDVGGRYVAAPFLDVSLVWRDIGSPVIANGTINATLVPGAAVRFLGDRASVGADWEVVTEGWHTSAVRIGATVRLPLHLALALRSELDSKLSSRSLAVALTWNGSSARVTGYHGFERSAGDQTGLWGAAVSSPLQRRRR